MAPLPPDRNAKFRVLLVKLKHIGDALILTPTIVAIRNSYPQAEIWVVVRKGTEGILEGCTAIDRVLAVTPVEAENRSSRRLLRDLRLWREIRRQRFDYAFELTDGDRGRLLAGTSKARHRCVNVSLYPLNFWWSRWFNQRSESKWTEGHRVEKDFQAVHDFLPLSGDIPALCFEREKAKEPDLLDGADDFVVFHPGTRWLKKRWPREHWIELGRQLLSHTGKIIVSSGPDEEERQLAAELVAAWGQERAVSTDGRLSWGQLAACLYRARLFVGVDTAAMHLAAACQCPQVAIFGYSVVSQWRPWKAPAELINLAAGHKQSEVSAEEIMRRQTPEIVLAAATRMIREIQQPD